MLSRFVVQANATIRFEDPAFPITVEWAGTIVRNALTPGDAPEPCERCCMVCGGDVVCGCRVQTACGRVLLSGRRLRVRHQRVVADRWRGATHSTSKRNGSRRPAGTLGSSRSTGGPGASGRLASERPSGRPISNIKPAGTRRGRRTTEGWPVGPENCPAPPSAIVTIAVHPSGLESRKLNDSTEQGRRSVAADPEVRSATPKRLLRRAGGTGDRRVRLRVNPTEGGREGRRAGRAPLAAALAVRCFQRPVRSWLSSAGFAFNHSHNSARARRPRRARRHDASRAALACAPTASPIGSTCRRPTRCPSTRESARPGSPHTRCPLDRSSVGHASVKAAKPCTGSVQPPLGHGRHVANCGHAQAMAALGRCWPLLSLAARSRKPQRVRRSAFRAVTAVTGGVSCAHGLYGTRFLRQWQPDYAETWSSPARRNRHSDRRCRFWRSSADAGANAVPAGRDRVNYATDALGSVRIVFTATGHVLGRSDYLPFGETLNQSGALPRQRFSPGQERDGEAGLDSFHPRSLPRTGRMNAPDPLFAGVPENPQAWNRYGYVQNRPFVLTDPTGLCGRSGADFCSGVSAADWLKQVKKRADFDAYAPLRPIPSHVPGAGRGGSGGRGPRNPPTPPNPPGPPSPPLPPGLPQPPQDPNPDDDVGPSEILTAEAIGFLEEPVPQSRTSSLLRVTPACWATWQTSPPISCPFHFCREPTMLSWRPAAV